MVRSCGSQRPRQNGLILRNGRRRMPPNAPSARTKETIRNIWKDMIASASSVSWKATRVEVAKSGDMAYVSGTYEVTMNDASGKPVNDHGKYLEVWEKQADGKWKC